VALIGNPKNNGTFSGGFGALLIGGIWSKRKKSVKNLWKEVKKCLCGKNVRKKVGPRFFVNPSKNGLTLGFW